MRRGAGAGGREGLVCPSACLPALCGGAAIERNVPTEHAKRDELSQRSGRKSHAIWTIPLGPGSCAGKETSGQGKQDPATACV